jgi:hypothetical protein
VSHGLSFVGKLIRLIVVATVICIGPVIANSQSQLPSGTPATAEDPRTAEANSKETAHDPTGDVWLKCTTTEIWVIQPGEHDRSVTHYEPPTINGHQIDASHVYVANAKKKYFLWLFARALEFPGTKNSHTDLGRGNIDTRVTKQEVKVTDDAITAEVEGTTLDGLFMPPRFYKWNEEYSISRQTLAYTTQKAIDGIVGDGTDGQCEKIDPRPVKEWPSNPGGPQF